MNPLYFLRANPWASFFREADKGGASAGGAQKPPTVPELTQRVKDLEAQLASANADKQKADADFTAQVAELNTAKAALAAEKAKVTALEGDTQKLTADLAAANAAKTKAEEDLKTTDARTELRLREISAKNGGTLPPKDHAAGTSQTGGNKEVLTMTRAAFDALTPAEKSEFSRKGGKLTDEK